MRSIIFAPVAWWERHWAYAIEVTNREVELGREVLFVQCFRALASCAPNPYHLEWKCRQCVHQSKYSSRRHFPSNVKSIRISNYDTDEKMFCLPDIHVKNAEELKAFTYKKFPFGQHVLSHLISVNRNRLLSDSLITNMGNTLLRNSIATYESILREIPEGGDYVFLWGGRRSSEAPMKFAGQTWNSKITFFEEGSEIDKVYLTENEITSYKQVHSDIVMWEKKRRDSSQVPLMLKSGEEYFASRKIGMSKEPNFRWFMRDSVFPEDSKDHSLPQLAIFTSSDWEFAEYESSKSDGFFENFKDQYSLLNHILHDVDLRKQFTIVVRWHPNHAIAGEEERVRIEEVISANPTVKHYRFDDKVDSYELSKRSKSVIVFGSTIGIESANSGIPTILLGEATYSGFGAVYEPETFEEFKFLTKKELKPLPNYWALVWADWSNCRGDKLRFITMRNSLFYINNKRVLKLRIATRIRLTIYKLLNYSFLRILK